MGPCRFGSSGACSLRSGWRSSSTYFRCRPMSVQRQRGGARALGAGRLLVFLNYPVSLVAIAIAWLSAERIADAPRAIRAAAVGNGAVCGDRLAGRGRPARSRREAGQRSLPAIGVAIAFVLSLRAPWERPGGCRSIRCGSSSDVVGLARSRSVWCRRARASTSPATSSSARSCAAVGRAASPRGSPRRSRGPRAALLVTSALVLTRLPATGSARHCSARARLRLRPRRRVAGLLVRAGRTNATGRRGSRREVLTPRLSVAVGVLGPPRRARRVRASGGSKGLGDPPQVLNEQRQLRLSVVRAQDRRGVNGRDHPGARSTRPARRARGDPELAAEQRLRGGGAEADEHPRLEQPRARLPARAARRDLGAVRLLVDAALPARHPLEVLDDVGHVDRARGRSRRVSSAWSRSFPAGPTNGLARLVLLVAGLLADEHRPRRSRRPSPNTVCVPVL